MTLGLCDTRDLRLRAYQASSLTPKLHPQPDKKHSSIFLNIILTYLFKGMFGRSGVYSCHSSQVAVREQLVGVGSLLPPAGFLRLNLGCQFYPLSHLTIPKVSLTSIYRGLQLLSHATV